MRRSQSYYAHSQFIKAKAAAAITKERLAGGGGGDEKEKLQEMQRNWIHVQKKTFQAWVNHTLTARAMSITDLSSDFSDGVVLINLLEILSGMSVGRYALKPNSRFLRIENVVIALKFIDQKIKLRLYGTSAEDIVDGNTKIILGMVWRLIQTFRLKMEGLGQGEEGALDDTPLEDTSSGSSIHSASASARVHNAFKNTLLSWCQRKLEGYPMVSVENFDSSFANGIAFCALIHRIHPNLIDLATLNKDNAVQNLQTAFTLAEQHFGIPQLLDPRDLVDSKPDELSVMTYISEFFHAYMTIERSRKADAQRLAEKAVAEGVQQQEEVETGDATAAPNNNNNKAVVMSSTGGMMTDEERTSMELEIAEGLDEVEQLKQKLKYQADECSVLRIKFAKKRRKLLEIRAREHEWKEKVESLLRENESLQRQLQQHQQQSPSSSSSSQQSQTQQQQASSSQLQQQGKQQHRLPSHKEQLRQVGQVVLPEKQQKSTRKDQQQDEHASATSSSTTTSSTTTSSIIRHQHHQQQQQTGGGGEPAQKVFGLRMPEPVIPHDLFKFLAEEVYIAKIFMDQVDLADGRAEGRDRESDNHWREDNKSARGETSDDDLRAGVDHHLHLHHHLHHVDEDSTTALWASPHNICALLLAQRQARVWLARRQVARLRLLKRFEGQEHRVVMLQARLRGFVARKHTRELADMLSQRTETARELLRSERVYLESLRVIVEVFMAPLRKAGSPLAPAQIKSIFSEVEVIMNYTAIMLDRVEKKLAAWSHNQCLGEIFLKLTDFLKVYTEYVYNFPKALTTFTACKQKGPFKTFLQECQNNVRCSDMDLITYLNMPVQRIPYYVAIFQTLLLYTPEDHPDWENTKLAVGKVKNVVKFIDEKRKRAENIQDVLRVQDSVVGKSFEIENLVQPSRRYIREGPLTVIRGAGEKTVGYGFLFNDLLIVTRKQKSIGKGRHTYKFVSAVQIGPRIAIKMCPETVYTTPNSFQLITLTKQYTFACDSDKQRRDWYNDLSEAVNMMVIHQKTIAEKIAESGTKPTQQQQQQQQMGTSPPARE